MDCFVIKSYLQAGLLLTQKIPALHRLNHHCQFNKTGTGSIKEQAQGLFSTN